MINLRIHIAIVDQCFNMLFLAGREYQSEKCKDALEKSKESVSTMVINGLLNCLCSFYSTSGLLLDLSLHSRVKLRFLLVSVGQMIDCETVKEPYLQDPCPSTLFFNLHCIHLRSTFTAAQPLS